MPVNGMIEKIISLTGYPGGGIAPSFLAIEVRTTAGSSVLEITQIAARELEAELRAFFLALGSR